MATFQTLNKKNYIIAYYIKNCFRSLRRGHLPLFDWKCLQIGTLRAKDLRQNVLIFLRGGLTPILHTLLVIRVVLLHTLYGIVQRFLSSTVCPTRRQIPLMHSVVCFNLVTLLVLKHIPCEI